MPWLFWVYLEDVEKQLEIDEEQPTSTAQRKDNGNARKMEMLRKNVHKIEFYLMHIYPKNLSSGKVSRV